MPLQTAVRMMKVVMTSSKKLIDKVTTYISNIKFSVGGGGQHVMTKWTQWYLRFFKNEESKISNNNEKGGQQDRKSRRKVVQIASKVSNDRCL